MDRVRSTIHVVKDVASWLYHMAARITCLAFTALFALAALELHSWWLVWPLFALAGATAIAAFVPYQLDEEDTLKRDVKILILKDYFGDDPERLTQEVKNLSDEDFRELLTGIVNESQSY